MEKSLSFKTIFDTFRDTRVLVVGDVILDMYEWCEVTRISPEAPVPVSKVLSQSFYLGGAGNVAHNISAFEAQAILVGVVGNDTEGDVVRELCVEKGIECAGLLVAEDRPTTVKRRIVSEAHQLLRVDRESTESVSGALHDALLAHVLRTINQIDAIILSDYGKGVLTDTLIYEIKREARKYNKKIFVDSKETHFSHFTGVYLIKPNKKEAERLAGEVFAKDYSNLPTIIDRLARTFDTNVVITLGADGIAAQEGDTLYRKPTEAREVYDVSGAGDTVIAALATASAAGVSLQSAIDIANVAAGYVVGHLGIGVCPLKILRERIYVEEKDIDMKFGMDTTAIQKEIDGAMETLHALKQDMGAVSTIAEIGAMLVETYSTHNKILIAGNGGSAADAQHFAAEITCQFARTRKARPAHALHCDTSALTAWGNDHSFETAFGRQVEAYGAPGDTLVCISTSGNSENLLFAAKAAREKGMRVIGILGRDGGALRQYCDVAVVVPAEETPHIQEAHIVIIHILCEMLDAAFAQMDRESY